MNICEVMQSPALFERHFGGASWEPWRTCLAAMFGLKLTKAQLAIYQECTRRMEPPTQPCREAALIIGRRGGKTRILALLAVYVAAFIDHTPYLAAGELAVIVVICPSRAQSRIAMRYVLGLLRSVPELAVLVESEMGDGVTLSTRVRIEVGTASFKVVRGYSYVLVCCDESAFWPKDESARPDTEILRALRPGMLNIPHSMLVLASSPYDKRGELWKMFKQHFGQDSKRTMIWRAPTVVMHPGIDEAAIAEEREIDPEAAAAEYDAQFREGLSQWISREVVEAAVEPSVV
jgi:hypothetical protein